jgi:hypothetical protein
MANPVPFVATPLQVAAFPQMTESVIHVAVPLASGLVSQVAAQGSAAVDQNTEIPIHKEVAFVQKREGVAESRLSKETPASRPSSDVQMPALEVPVAMAAPLPQTEGPRDAVVLPSVTPEIVTRLAMSPNQVLSNAINELTDAMMVHMDESGHLSEIRLMLKPDVLDGASVLLKSDGQQVFVTFFTGTGGIEQLLLANQSRIVEALAASGQLPVQVSIINAEGQRHIRKSLIS